MMGLGMSVKGRILGPVFALGSVGARHPRDQCQLVPLGEKRHKKREFLLAGTGTLQLAVRNSSTEVRRPTAVQHLSVLSMLELYSALKAGRKIKEEGQKA
jgi:hypothetical protein